MTTKSPTPVSAYAAVSPNDGIVTSSCGPAIISVHNKLPFLAKQHAGAWTVIPVTILPTEQYEGLMESLEELLDAAKTVGAGVVDPHAIRRAEAALAALKEQEHG
tara:strand:- start:48 stop:362 length:315 start_codon:yes stop_codon:yes gene_type:complete